MVSPCSKVRETCKWVCDQAIHVAIDQNAIDAFVNNLSEEEVLEFYTLKAFDRELHLWAQDDPDLVAHYLLTVDCLNHCFWLQPGLEYEHLASGIKNAAIANPSCISAASLSTITEQQLNNFLQGTNIESFPNATERLRLLQELGNALLTHFEGKAGNMVRAANNSATALVSLLTAHCPGFQDHTIYKGRQVFFYKRAQIFVGDLLGAFQGRGLGEFHDINQITMFADYRVPVVLRELGILNYTPKLAEKVDSRVELVSGCEEEVEIRAATVEAVELIKVAIHRRVLEISADVGDERYKEPPLSVALDWYLWETGEKNIANHKPHHRTMTIYY